MQETEAGLIVPDHVELPSPTEKIEVRWQGYEVEAFDRASQTMINKGIHFMAVCPTCATAQRNGMMSAYGLDGIVFLECDCTVHVLPGPQARKNLAKARRKLER